MSSTSADAFKFSVDRLTEAGVCYLWTFTFPVALDLKVARRKWAGLSKDLVRVLDYQGLRVFELHPDGHGLHIHVLALGRYSLRLVRLLSRIHGFGRVHVTKRVQENPYYLAKYLSKTDRAPCLKGMRLWASIGSWGHTKCKSVKRETETSAAVRIARKIEPDSGWRRLSALAIDIQWHAVCLGRCLLDDLASGSWSWVDDARKSDTARIYAKASGGNSGVPPGNGSAVPSAAARRAAA